MSMSASAVRAFLLHLPSLERVQNPTARISVVADPHTRGAATRGTSCFLLFCTMRSGFRSTSSQTLSHPHMSAKKQKVSAEERIFLFSSESVNEGHPDKLADQVSDAVLDACLTEDPMSKVRSRRRVSLCSARGAPAHGRSRLARTPPHRRVATPRRRAAALTAHPCPGRSLARRRPRTTW